MNRWLKALVIAVAAALAVVVLFTVVFPWVDRTFVADPVMDSAPARATVGG